jgi:hypothetical protein
MYQTKYLEMILEGFWPVARIVVIVTYNIPRALPDETSIQNFKKKAKSRAVGEEMPL